MSKLVTLADNNNEELYPITTASAVYMGEGQTVEDMITKGMPMVLLWENPSPSNSFSSQTITLADNICDYFIVQFTVDGNHSSLICDSVIIKVGEGAIGSLIAGESGLQAGNMYINNRVIYSSTQTSITFSDSWRVGGSSDTGHTIPKRVLGFKLGNVNMVADNYYQQCFSGFGYLRTEGNNSWNHGYVQYIRTGPKCGFLTISMKMEAQGGGNFTYCSLKNISSILGLSFKIPSSSRRSGTWTATDGASASNQGYGASCEINASGWIVAGRFYTTAGAFGGWASDLFGNQGVLNIYNVYVEEN